MTANGVTPDKVRTDLVVSNLSKLGFALTFFDSTNSRYDDKMSESRGTLPSLSTHNFLNAYRDLLVNSV